MREKEIIIKHTKIGVGEDLKQTVYDKVERLFRHEDDIIRIQVELGHDDRKNKEEEYFAKGHIEINGPPMIVTVASNDITKSIDQMVDKLDRKIRRRSRLNKVKRKNIHSVDVPSHLPKVADV